ncbi:UNVERIFIED_CONTAM: hypothetical protein HHA_215620 [Hammondia hammondi]|eukprot:XP_008886636.1 hypothetical protein HHA_215620 [Hammondia hammondi]
MKPAPVSLSERGGHLVLAPSLVPESALPGSASPASLSPNLACTLEPPTAPATGVATLSPSDTCLLPVGLAPQSPWPPPSSPLPNHASRVSHVPSLPLSHLSLSASVHPQVSPPESASSSSSSASSSSSSTASRASFPPVAADVVSSLHSSPPSACACARCAGHGCLGEGSLESLLEAEAPEAARGRLLAFLTWNDLARLRGVSRQLKRLVESAVLSVRAVVLKRRWWSSWASTSAAKVSVLPFWRGVFSSPEAELQDLVLHMEGAQAMSDVKAASELLARHARSLQTCEIHTDPFPGPLHRGGPSSSSAFRFLPASLACAAGARGDPPLLFPALGRLVLSGTWSVYWLVALTAPHTANVQPPRLSACKALELVVSDPALALNIGCGEKKEAAGVPAVPLARLAPGLGRMSQQRTAGLGKKPVCRAAACAGAPEPSISGHPNRGEGGNPGGFSAGRTAERVRRGPEGESPLNDGLFSVNPPEGRESFSPPCPLGHQASGLGGGLCATDPSPESLNEAAFVSSLSSSSRASAPAAAASCLASSPAATSASPSLASSPSPCASVACAAPRRASSSIPHQMRVSPAQPFDWLLYADSIFAALPNLERLVFDVRGGGSALLFPPSHPLASEDSPFAELLRNSQVHRDPPGRLARAEASCLSSPSSSLSSSLEAPTPRGSRPETPWRPERGDSCLSSESTARQSTQTRRACSADPLGVAVLWWRLVLRRCAKLREAVVAADDADLFYALEVARALETEARSEARRIRISLRDDDGERGAEEVKEGAEERCARGESEEREEKVQIGANGEQQREEPTRSVSRGEENEEEEGDRKRRRAMERRAEGRAFGRVPQGDGLTTNEGRDDNGETDERQEKTSMETETLTGTHAVDGGVAAAALAEKEIAFQERRVVRKCDCEATEIDWKQREGSPCKQDSGCESPGNAEESPFAGASPAVSEGLEQQRKRRRSDANEETGETEIRENSQETSSQRCLALSRVTAVGAGTGFSSLASVSCLLDDEVLVSNFLLDVAESAHAAEGVAFDFACGVRLSARLLGVDTPAEMVQKLLLLPGGGRPEAGEARDAEVPGQPRPREPAGKRMNLQEVQTANCMQCFFLPIFLSGEGGEASLDGAEETDLCVIRNGLFRRAWVRRLALDSCTYTVTVASHPGQERCSRVYLHWLARQAAQAKRKARTFDRGSSLSHAKAWGEGSAECRSSTGASRSERSHGAGRSESPCHLPHSLSSPHSSYPLSPDSSSSSCYSSSCYSSSCPSSSCPSSSSASCSSSAASSAASSSPFSGPLSAACLLLPSVQFLAPGGRRARVSVAADFLPVLRLLVSPPICEVRAEGARGEGGRRARGAKRAGDTGEGEDRRETPGSSTERAAGETVQDGASCQWRRQTDGDEDEGGETNEEEETGSPVFLNGGHVRSSCVDRRKVALTSLPPSAPLSSPRAQPSAVSRRTSFSSSRTCLSGLSSPRSFLSASASSVLPSSSSPPPASSRASTSAGRPLFSLGFVLGASPSGSCFTRPWDVEREALIGICFEDALRESCRGVEIFFRLSPLDGAFECRGRNLLRCLTWLRKQQFVSGVGEEGRNHDARLSKPRERRAPERAAECRVSSEAPGDLSSGRHGEDVCADLFVGVPGGPRGEETLATSSGEEEKEEERIERPQVTAKTRVSIPVDDDESSLLPCVSLLDEETRKHATKMTPPRLLLLRIVVGPEIPGENVIGGERRGEQEIQKDMLSFFAAYSDSLRFVEVEATHLRLREEDSKLLSLHSSLALLKTHATLLDAGFHVRGLFQGASPRDFVRLYERET